MRKWLILLGLPLLMGMTPNNNPLSEDADLNTSVQQVFDEAQDKNFRLIEQSTPTLQNTKNTQVLFTNTNGFVKFWVRIKDVLYSSDRFNQRTAYAVYCPTSSKTMDSVGFSTISRTATGYITFTLDSPMSNTNYSVICTPAFTTGVSHHTCEEEDPGVFTKTSTQFRIVTADFAGGTGNAVDVFRVNVIVIGR